MSFNLQANKKAASWFKVINAEGSDITLEFKKVHKNNKIFEIAHSKKELKRLQRSEADVIYESLKGKLYFNANGIRDGWGAKNRSGFFAKLSNKPSLSISNLNGYKNLYQNRFEAYTNSWGHKRLSSNI